MTRDIFQTTFTQKVSGALAPLAGIEVTVYPADSTSAVAPIFQKRTGVGQGPAIESGASGGPNPFTTGDNGYVEFWAPAGVYDIHIRDTQSPERIPKRGNGGALPPLQWNSSPASVGSLPSSVIASDGGLILGALGQDILRQLSQIGQFMYWWRPSSSVPIPTGWEILDGRTIPAGSHDFPVGGAITLPDLRNVFIIGADPFKADGAATVVGDGTAASGAVHPNAPGIRGSGGSMLATLSVANLPAHNHAITDPGHVHGFNGYDARFSMPSGKGTVPVQPTGGSNWGLPWQSGGASPVTAATTGISVQNNGSGTGHANAPLHYGLLPLMKVKRA